MKERHQNGCIGGDENDRDSPWAAFFLLHLVCAEEYEDSETEHIRMFNTAYKFSIGKRVMVDALVWHYPGTSGRGGGEVITPTGQVIFVRDAYAGNRNGSTRQILPQVKLVRITGILELGPAPTLTIDGEDAVLATGDGRSHLNIRMESYDLIETATFPWPAEIPEEAGAENSRSEPEVIEQSTTPQ